jgi:hypothetical protein
VKEIAKAGEEKEGEEEGGGEGVHFEAISETSSLRKEGESGNPVWASD